MKKYISILLATLFVFGFAASAFAMHAEIPTDTTATVSAGETQITLSGEVRVRYDWRHVGFNNNDSQSETAFANERIRLGIDAKLSPNTEGMIQFTSETDPAQADRDNLVGGGTTSSTGNVAGFDQSEATGIFSKFLNGGNEFKGQVAIRQMWILHTGTGLLGVNAGIKVGHMPLLLGSGLFYDHSYFGDDAVVLFVDPIKELELSLVGIDFSDGYFTSGSTATVTKSNHDTGYAFVANYKPDTNSNISFDATYVDDQNIGDTSGAMGVYPDIHLWNFGLRGKTEVSGIRLKIDGEMQVGKLEQLASQNIDFHGYAVQAGAGYTLDPVKLDVEVGYGSGDNGKNSRDINTFVTSQGPESTFGDPYRGVGLQGGIQGPYVYNYRTINAAGETFGGLANTMYLRVGGNADLTKDANLDLAVFYLRAVDAITSTNAPLYNLLANPLTGAADPFSVSNVNHAGYNPSKDIGVELDGRLTYKIDKGLVTWVEGGYLWAGDFWKAVAAVTPGNSPSNAYTMRTGIQLNF